MAYDEGVADRIRAALAGDPDLTERKMFGGLGFMIAGNMAVAANSSGDLMVRVDPEQTAELVGRPGARPQEMRGRALRGWIHVDAAVITDDADLADWVTLGAAYARSLPPK